MKTIKFSHNYSKLQGQVTAELLAVKDIKINKDTPQQLINYDTIFIEGENIQYYKLKPGNYIQLIFLGNFSIPFCTIRAAYPTAKVEYYKNSIGETFKIEVEVAKS